MKNSLNSSKIRPLLILILLLIQASLLVQLTSVMPVYHPVDELYHYDYIIKLKENGGFFATRKKIHPSIIESVEKYSYDSISYGAVPTIKEEDYKPDLNNVTDNVQIIQHPPLYYYFMTFFISLKFAPLNHIINVHILRIAGLILFLISGYLWASGLSRLLKMKGLFLFILFMIWTWTPTDFFRVSNDMGLFFVSGLTIFVFSHAYKQEDITKTGYSFLLGICLSACIWTKFNLIYLLLPFLVIYRILQHFQYRRSIKKSSGKSILLHTTRCVFTDPALIIPGVSLILLKILFKFEIYEPPMRSDRLCFVSFWHSYSKLIFGETMWHGRFSGLDIPDLYPKILLGFFGVGAMAVLFIKGKSQGAVLEDKKTDECNLSARTGGLLVLGMATWMIFVQCMLIMFIPWFCQGRYLIPAVPVSIAVTIAGFRRIGSRIPRVHQDLLPVIITVTWISINISHLYKYLVLMSGT